MVQKTINVNSNAGINARAITQLVQTASRFDSDIYLTYEGRKVNLKSIMGVLSLGIPKHAEITLQASGVDDKEAVNQLIETIESLA